MSNVIDSSHCIRVGFEVTALVGVEDVERGVDHHLIQGEVFAVVSEAWNFAFKRVFMRGFKQIQFICD